MEIIFGVIGFALFLIGWARILITAFSEDILWGLGCLVFTPVMPIFVFLNWHNTKTSFLISMVGIGVFILAAIF